MLRLHKNDTRVRSRIALIILLGFISQIFFALLGIVLFPIDYSTHPPVYPVNLLLLQEVGQAFAICSMVLMGIKLADEKEVLPAAGFTILSIAFGLIMVTNFEIIAGRSNIESVDISFQMYFGANLLAIPGILMVSMYSHYQRWLNLTAVISVIPYLITQALYFSGYKEFTVIDGISTISWILQSFVMIMWGVHAWKNRNEEHA